jgi:ABC-2 type transport system permease protein
MYYLQAIGIIFHRELIRYWRERTRVISTLVQPLLFLAIFGAGLSRTLSAQNFGVNFVQFMYPGIIAMGVMSVAFFSTISTVWDKEFGFLKEILVAPVPRLAISLGKTISAAAIASTQALVLLVLAPFIGVHIHLSAIPEFIGILLLLAFSIAGLGLWIASRMKSMESFGLIMQLLVMPMFFLSGAFFPLTAVPGWLAVLTRINPLSYGVDAVRQILLGGQIDPSVLAGLSIHTIATDALFLIGFGAVMVVAAVRAFDKSVA